MTETIDITPDWYGVYRWLMHVKKHDQADYDHLIKDGDGELEKLLNLAKAKGWDKEVK